MYIYVVILLYTTIIPKSIRTYFVFSLILFDDVSFNNSPVYRYSKSWLIFLERILVSYGHYYSPLFSIHLYIYTPSVKITNVIRVTLLFITILLLLGLP